MNALNEEKIHFLTSWKFRYSVPFVAMSLLPLDSTKMGVEKLILLCSIVLFCKKSWLLIC